MPTVSINNITYHYTTAGPESPDCPPLVLLHGFTGSSTNWRALQRAFAHTRPTIAIDILGHGQTGAPDDPTRYAMEQSAHDLIALLDTVAPGPVDLLGYSMGGRLALYLARHYPQHTRRLILESASPGLADTEARRARVESDAALANRMEAEGLEAFVDFWEQVPLFASQQSLTEAARQRLRAQRLRNRPTGLANSLRNMGTGSQPSLWNELSALAMPTLLITGARDEKFCTIAQQMVKQIPNGTHVTIRDAGHTVHLEQTLLFLQEIREYLKE